jgi:hypothetical protein
VNARAVESSEETSSAPHRKGVGRKTGFSIHEKLARARTAVVPSCRIASDSNGAVFE